MRERFSSVAAVGLRGEKLDPQVCFGPDWYLQEALRDASHGGAMPGGNAPRLVSDWVDTQRG